MSTEFATIVAECGDKIRWLMAKDTRLTFRVRSELKKNLEAIAEREARSVAQVCEVILHDGVTAYQKEGPKYLQRLLSHQKKHLL
jgi:hypothetical protein